MAELAEESKVKFGARIAKKRPGLLRASSAAGLAQSITNSVAKPTLVQAEQVVEYLSYLAAGGRGPGVP
jgi:hypothetical protein